MLLFMLLYLHCIAAQGSGKLEQQFVKRNQLLLTTANTKLMIGPGDQDIKRHTEIVDLSGTLTSCPDISSYPISLNYAGVGAFVDGRGLICGGYNDYNTTLDSHTSTNRCFSWNVEVHHINMHSN